MTWQFPYQNSDNPYIAERFNAMGYFNGFPFLLTPKEDWMLSPGVSGDVFQLEVAANNFWNIAAVDCYFKIDTMQQPAGYETGYAYDKDESPSPHQNNIQAYFEVVNSYNEELFPPKWRTAIENTGESQVQTINEKGLIEGSGSGYNSFYVHNGPDMLTPLTIQPENTGAFVITLDSGVAQYFQDLPEYGNWEKFEMGMCADYGFQILNEEGEDGQDHKLLHYKETGYMVPALGWRFEVSGTAYGRYWQYDYPAKKSNTKYGPYEPPSSRPHPIR